MSQTVKIGDTVLWRGGWGAEPEKRAKVIGLEITQWHEKDGKEVNEADWSLAQDDCLLFTLDNGHWAYGTQCRPLPSSNT